MIESPSSIGFPLRELENMSTNPSLVPEEASRIDIGEDYEVQFWSKELGVSQEHLRELVEKHGAFAETVRKAIYGH